MLLEKQQKSFVTRSHEAMFILCMLERSFHTNTDENKYKTYENFKTVTFTNTITNDKHLKISAV